MGKAHSIPPFPTDIDRVAFGHWLAGFVDGEGCFRLGYHRHPRTGKNTIGIRFGITIRADDTPVLLLIQSYLGCGSVRAKRKRREGNRNPTVHFEVERICDHATKLVPVFDRCPLRAKKARDYAIWRQGVALVHGIQSRGLRTQARYTEAELEQFKALARSLRDQRSFDPSRVPAGLLVAATGYASREAR